MTTSVNLHNKEVAKTPKMKDSKKPILSHTIIKLVKSENRFESRKMAQWARQQPAKSLTRRNLIT